MAPSLCSYLTQEDSSLYQQGNRWVTKRRRTSGTVFQVGPRGLGWKSHEQRQWDPSFERNNTVLHPLASPRVSRLHCWARAYKHPREAPTSAAHSPAAPLQGDVSAEAQPCPSWDTASRVEGALHTVTLNQREPRAARVTLAS